MTIIDTREISEAIETRSLQLRESKNEWIAVEEVVAAQIAPLVAHLGSSAVLDALEERSPIRSLLRSSWLEWEPAVTSS